MIIDPEALDVTTVYKLMSNTIFPRPIAWISTEGEGGLNLAPFSYFIPVSSNPPCVMVSIGPNEEGGLKDTAKNILLHGKATISLADDANAGRIDATAEALPYGESEAEKFGISMAPTVQGYPPRVADAKAALLCSLHQEVALSGSEQNILFLKIDAFYYADDVIDERHNVRLHNIGRVGRDYLVDSKRIKG
ncbi:MAG: flavin reductase family protein [Campylobacterales bacterium]|nr:flavin reductase family protein [Campylobacterales bacterium]